VIDPASPQWLARLRRSLGRLADPVVVVAVSGGGDSIGLLRALAGLAPDLGLRLSVAHLDHGTRGAEGRGDAEFVAGLAGRYGLPFDLGRWAPTRPGHFEADARRARYGWLAEVAGRRGAGAVAVGQTLDDQAETILHRIVRGTGVGGLAGMPRRRRLAPGVVLIRPLLGVSRREVRDYLAAIGQEFREDSSNLDTTRTRARIRLDLLPKLADEYNPAVVAALVRLGRLAAETDRAASRRIGRLARGLVIEANPGCVVLDRPGLARLRPFERAEIIRVAWRSVGWPEGEMDARRWRRLAALVLAERTQMSVGAEVEAKRTQDCLTLRRSPVLPDPDNPTTAVLKIPGVVAWENGRILAILNGEESRDESVDLNRIVPPLVVRQAGPGERFEPLGMDGRSQTLNDFFRGRRVDRARRATVPIVCDRDGIVWVVGHRISHRVRLTEATRQTLGLRFEPSPEKPG